MSKDKEVITETNWLGEEKKVIYEDGERVGEIRTEQRGGLFGIGSETVDVKYNNDGDDVSYTRKEERRGLFGIGENKTDVTYDTLSGKEIEHSRVEERGGFFGLGSNHTRVGYDKDGNEVSQTNYERRGGFLGFGGARVKVTRYHNKESGFITEQNSNSSGNSTYLKSLPSNVTTQLAPSVKALLKPILFLIIISITGQLLLLISKTGDPYSDFARLLGFFEILLFIPWGIICIFLSLLGFLLSIPLFLLEHFTGICIFVMGFCGGM